MRPHFPGQAVQEGEKKPTFFERHKKYYGAFTSLALTATFAWISYLIQLGTGLSATIWASSSAPSSPTSASFRRTS